MWPFEARVRRSLVGLSRLSRVDVTATIVSADDVRSPLSELRAAFVWIQLTESSRLTRSREDLMGLVGSGADLSHFDGEHVVGSVVLGDTLVLRTEDALEVALSPRTARVVFARRNPRRAESSGPLTHPPPELATLVERAAGSAVLYREIGLLQGSRVRLRAFVEPASRVARTAYRSVAKPSFAVREDAGPVELVELLGAR